MLPDCTITNILPSDIKKKKFAFTPMHLLDLHSSLELVPVF